MSTSAIAQLKKNSKRVKVPGVGQCYYSQEMQDFLDSFCYIVAPESCGAKAYLHDDDVTLVGCSSRADEDTLNIILDALFLRRYPNVPKLIDENFQLSSLKGNDAIFFPWPLSLFSENHRGEKIINVGPDNDVIAYHKASLNLSFSSVYEIITNEKLYGEVIFSPAKRGPLDGILVTRNTMPVEKFCAVSYAIVSMAPMVFRFICVLIARAYGACT